jgi:hypothetical protein
MVLPIGLLVRRRTIELPIRTEGALLHVFGKADRGRQASDEGSLNVWLSGSAAAITCPSSHSVLKPYKNKRSLIMRSELLSFPVKMTEAVVVEKPAPEHQHADA